MAASGVASQRCPYACGANPLDSPGGCKSLGTWGKGEEEAEPQINKIFL